MLRSRIAATILQFPRLRATLSGEEYTYNLGAIGKPSDKDVVQLGSLGIELVRQCIDLGGTDDVGNAKELQAQGVKWDVTISPHESGDKLSMSNSSSENPGVAKWSFIDLTRPKVVFTDKSLRNAYQATLFVGGLLAGIGTNFLVQGLTGLTKKSRN